MSVEESAALHGQLWYMCVGDYIGRGRDRKVYALGEDKVLKTEDAAGSFQNIVEWETWKTLEGCSAQRWFAKPTSISPNGALLIMERTKPLDLDRLPKELPHFFCDLKPENFGTIGGRLVCHDYGTIHILAMDHLTKTLRTRRAQWILEKKKLA